MAVRSSRASSGFRGVSGSPTNSENEGTALSLSLKYVGRRFGAAGSGVEASVAKERQEAEMNDREACSSGGAFRHLNLVAVAAIMDIRSLNDVELRRTGTQQCLEMIANPGTREVEKHPAPTRVLPTTRDQRHRYSLLKGVKRGNVLFVTRHLSKNHSSLKRNQGLKFPFL